MKDTIKKVISIFLTVTITSVSVFAIGEEYETTSGNLQLYDGSINTVITNQNAQVNSINPDPLTLNEFWDNWHEFMVYNLGAFLETYIPSIASDTRTWLNMWRINNGTEGIYHRLFTRLVDTQSWSGMTNLYDLFVKLRNIESDILSNNTILNTIKTYTDYIDDDTSLIQSDIRGLYNMFASGVSGGSYYYRTFNELYNPNTDSGLLADIGISSSNASAGITNANTYLLNIDNKLGASGSIGQPIEEINTNTYHIRYLRQILLGTYETSTGESNLIYDIYNRLGNISTSLGYSSSSTLSSDIADLVDSQDEAVSGLGQISGQLDDIIDVLANDEDQTIVDNSTQNKNTIIPIFFNTDVDVDTSIHPSDFTSLGNIVKAIRGLLNVGVPISGFSAALSEAADEGLEFFSQDTIDDLYNIGE